MNSKILLLVLSIGIINTQSSTAFLPSDTYRTACYAYGEYSFFDIRALEQHLQDYMFSSKASLPDGNVSYVDTYVFNLCKPTAKSCDSSEPVWAYKNHNDT